MRLGDAPESSNFEDRTGQSGGGGMSLGGMGGGLFGLLAQLSCRASGWSGCSSWRSAIARSAGCWVAAAGR